LSAFFLYSQANRTRVREENPDATFGEIARYLTRQFKELPEQEVRKWAKKAEGDRARYREEMKDYVPVNHPEGGDKTSNRAKKDLVVPKRNVSAYFLYTIAVRPSIKEENPAASFSELARIIAARFYALGDKERKVWDDQAAAYNDRYNAEMEDCTVSANGIPSPIYRTEAA
jgi:HMG (high mobility group) box